MPAYSYKQLSTEFHTLFGTKQQQLDAAWLKKLQYSCWLGNTAMPMRGISWRVLLGVLPLDLSLWPSQMEKNYREYEQLKKDHLPNINEVKVDPLSGMCSAAKEEADGDWDAYYKKVDVIKFIQGDLERLYMNGIEDEYFQEAARARPLLNVLFVWAQKNTGTSGYRQGMHEIAAPVLLVLEAETSSWSAALRSKSSDAECGIGPDQSLTTYFSSEKYLESSLYWLFERIMQDLEYLYTPPSQAGELPGVVHFCTQVQEEMLRALDPTLCTHLEENYVQAQLYGMRWSRLLLGREFQVTEESLLRIWDYIFASSLDVNAVSKPLNTCRNGVDIISPVSAAKSSERVGHADPLFSAPSAPVSRGGGSPGSVVDEWTTSSAAMKAQRKSRLEKVSPILESLADFMLAMLLHIREDLLHGDNSTTLQLLMRYPAVDDITPIVDLADMIRRGVLDSHSHVGASAKGVEDHKSTGSAAAARAGTGTGTGSAGGKGLTPTWLWREASTTIDHDNNNDSTFSIRKNLQGVTKRMGQSFSNAVSTSVSAFSHDDANKKSQQQDGNKESDTAAPKRKTSIGTRNSLFGISARGRSNSNSASLFGGDPLSNENSPQPNGYVVNGGGGDGEGESLVTIDKLVIEQDKCSVLAQKDINRLAACLETWTADKARQDPSDFMPDVIAQLRGLGGLLDQSLSLSEYTLRYGDDKDKELAANGKSWRSRSMSAESLSGLNRKSLDEPAGSVVAEAESKTPSKPDSEEKSNKEEVFGKEFFASTFGLLADNDEDKIATKQSTKRLPTSSAEWPSTQAVSSPRRKEKTKDEADKFHAIFSDLTGGDKKAPEKSPFDV